MPRQPRYAPGGLIYHVMNRAAAKHRMLRTDKDHLAFEQIMVEAMTRHPIRLLAWCVMDNHWHFVAWPRETGELTAFFRWLTLTHAMRWRVSHRSVGYGPLYQGRFKSFPVQEEHGLAMVCRYVERNAKSAGLVQRAQDWRWGSLHARLHGTESQRALLSPWPIAMPQDWTDRVNAVITRREAERVEQSILRGTPLGDPQWVERTAKRLGLGHTLRPKGRPRKRQA